jgi:type II secretory pathway component PulF
LEQASRRIDRGGEWCDSLRQSQIISRAESVLFKAAERAGNLPWALEEMADSGQRRSSYRLRAWTAVLFPLAVIVFAGPVLFLALAVLTPLFQMIEGLA